VTAELKRGIMPNLGITWFRDLQQELDNANIWRKTRLLYALKYRTQPDVDSILYRIRNGKAYATEFTPDDPKKYHLVYDIVYGSIVKDIEEKVEDKRIFIPEYMNYVLPTTEKMFTGNFPTGSYVTIPNRMVFGINWKNAYGRDIDLDLSIIDDNGQKFGWDSSYRDETGSILFSGDMTSARGKDGSTELFYIGEPEPMTGIMYVNYYNWQKDQPIDFKIMVANQEVRSLKKNYMVKPESVRAVANSRMNEDKQQVLGVFISHPEGGHNFYFTETHLGRGITSGGQEWTNQARRFLINYYRYAVTLEDMLREAGATIISKEQNIHEAVKIDIDLSPEALERDTIIRLLT
jgi:hypothetical protein